jgi:ATP-binding cassette subfamily C protein
VIATRILRHLVQIVRSMRWRVGLALLAICGASCLEGAGLLLLIPLLGAIGLDVRQGSIGRLQQTVSSVLAILGIPPTLGGVLVLFAVMNAVLAGVRAGQTLLAAALEQRVVRETRQSLYSAILRMNWLTFSRMRAADLILALTAESERAGLAASQLLNLTASTLVTAVYVGLAARLSLTMTLGVFVCGAGLLVFLRRGTRRSTELGEVYSDSVHELQAAATDDLAGMKTIRSFVAEDRSLARFSALADRIVDVNRLTFRNYAAGSFFQDTGSVIVLSTLVFIAVNVLRFNASSLLMLLFLFARIVPRLASLQQHLQYYANILPSCARLAELEARCVAAAEPAAADSPALALRHRLRLDSVSWQYRPEGPKILSDFTLAIEAGTTVALVGSSGAGKTTVADVVMGLLAPQSGRVLVDDHPLTGQIAKRWRQSIAYVPQDTFLFHDTIRANLLWAAPEATEQDLQHALHLAAADFVLGLQEGLDTVVGDRGVRLSGGERQRIALARALLRRPSLLVLDEATSALDSENENRIFDAIHRLRGSITIFIITHRVSTVAEADVIHVIENGRVVESGSWRRLGALSGRFVELCRAQGVWFARETADITTNVR